MAISEIKIQLRPPLSILRLPTSYRDRLHKESFGEKGSLGFLGQPQRNNLSRSRIRSRNKEIHNKMQDLQDEAPKAGRSASKAPKTKTPLLQS